MKKQTKEKEKELGKTAELLLKIFLITIVSILCFAMFYASIKWTHNYFTMNDEQICHDSNSTLVNGQCHSECNRPVKDQRNMLLIGGIAFPIFAMLLIFYMVLVLKNKFE